MDKIGLRKATMRDQSVVTDIALRLDKVEYILLKREEKILKAISNEECFIISNDNQTVGFILFDYRFFDRGWIELMVINPEYRGRGIGTEAINLICLQSKTEKVFTSTNRSNMPMQRAIEKAGFSFAGELIGLDEGDPELFYFKIL
jgi:RimJ/RimL family protein N-acetyltransferase